ncbi:phytoene desaturase family protein [Terriglobus tenax]|uniref:phytoene desaturase family protein n=1 Tax=Terriglobus tenax TaxID=1111115 RepID=UPI0021DF8A0F|nr:NAD(P)/FAD-dependent oxidoreductase [Terriglobus tenax]
MNPEWDAIIVGAGPNGFAAAITLQRAGLRTLLLEGAATTGGGTRSAELTLPGFLHDVCSAIHPMAAVSPFLRSLPLQELGLTLIEPPVQAAHPFDDGETAALYRSLAETEATLDDADRSRYHQTFAPLVEAWPRLIDDVLGPLHLPRHPMDIARFGLQAFRSASSFVGQFSGKKAKGLFAGMAAHSFLELDQAASAAIGLTLSIVGHTNGWPIPKGGSQSIATALEQYYLSLGGVLHTNTEVKSLAQLPTARAVLFDLTPKQLLRIAGESFSDSYRGRLTKYRYGMGVFKMDWALSGPTPFTAEACRLAGTVHIGGTFEEIARSESDAAKGRHSQRPFVLFAQQSIFDASRAPTGKHTAWAYCHVPNGSTVDMSEAIERQIERFAPGFRDLILARRTANTAQMELYNPNFVGGDINGGAIDITQLFTRPVAAISPYRTSAKGIYLCSSSTPPGGGVHGMCGYHAALRAMKDIFPGTLPKHG